MAQVKSRGQAMVNAARSSASKSLGAASSSGGERLAESDIRAHVAGKVEAATSEGCRVNGVWHAYPPGWSGWRPAVGQVVRIDARLSWTIERIEPAADSASPAAGAAKTQPARPSSALSSEGAPSGSSAAHYARVNGVVAASNERGVKVGEVWYNYSRFTPLPEAVRERLVPGAKVCLGVDRQRWIADAEIAGEAEAGAGEDYVDWTGEQPEPWDRPNQRWD